MAQKPPQHEITQLLAQWREGNQSALDELYPLVYDELHRLARRYMSRERKGHTLQTTALINEAYVRLVDQKNVPWANRSHFFAISAQIMRRILIDHARARHAEKRQSPLGHAASDGQLLVDHDADRLLAVDAALRRLAEWDARQAKVVELRFFGGLTVEETADALGISSKTVKRDWSLARAWLHTQIEGPVHVVG